MTNNEKRSNVVESSTTSEGGQHAHPPPKGGKAQHPSSGGSAPSSSKGKGGGEGDPRGRGSKGNSRNRSRNSSNNSQNDVKVVKANKNSRGNRGSKAAQKQAAARKLKKPSARDYEDEERRTIYIGFIERGTTANELLNHFKDCGDVERVTLKEGFGFILFKDEKSVAQACKLDGSSLRGLNLRVAPRKEQAPEVEGEVLLTLDMKKFRNEKQDKLFTELETFINKFESVASFSQDQKEPNAIIIPGCPPVLDWNKMDAEEGEITLCRQAENAPELNTTDSILKAVEQCSPHLDLTKVGLVTNRSCLMKLLAPVDPSIVYTTNKCFKMTAVKSKEGPISLELESKWHPTMGTTKSFQDAITFSLPEKVKNLAHPGIFYRIVKFELGSLQILVRTQVHAEDEEPMLEFEEDDFSQGESEGEGGMGTGTDADDDFFQIEERNGDSPPPPGASDDKDAKKLESDMKKLRVNAAEFVPPVHSWNVFPGTDLRWVKNDAVFSIPESRYEVKTVDIAGNFWEYNAEKSFYQMLLSGTDYLMLGVLLNNTYVINKEEYDLKEVHTKVLGTKNPTDATLVLSKMEKILSKILQFATDLKEDERLDIVFDGKKETLTFYRANDAAKA
eukprot:TRINITY_DN6674_c0_g1_i1.p1 TRINITY_DN6674_c0_g1~~TRINITY_DN6674_c0_g1_i1.p1  ORF type:complete len:618 (-),score=184.03 TRINITY_DN6674_c0_g1_i1:212-2065(-)